MVNRDRSHVDELGEIILVRRVVPMPGDNVKRAVVLRALEEASAKLIHDLPRIIARNSVIGLGIQKVPCVSKTV